MENPDAQPTAFLQSHRVARLATADRLGRPHVVPICYVYDGTCLYSLLDQKPKRVPLVRLKRMRNILENHHVALVVDDYSEDWSRLAYVLITGSAQLLEASEEQRRAVALLREKYPQYRRMDVDNSPVIKITPERITTWEAID